MRGALHLLAGLGLVLLTIAPLAQSVQVDVRLTRTFKVGRVSVQPGFSAYNVLNAGSVLSLNSRYGGQWQNVLTLLAPRLMKFGVQVNF